MNTVVFNWNDVRPCYRLIVADYICTRQFILYIIIFHISCKTGKRKGVQILRFYSNFLMTGLLLVSNLWWYTVEWIDVAVVVNYHIIWIIIYHYIEAFILSFTPFWSDLDVRTVVVTSTDFLSSVQMLHMIHKVICLSFVLCNLLFDRNVQIKIYPWAPYILWVILCSCSLCSLVNDSDFYPDRRLPFICMSFHCNSFVFIATLGWQK